MSRPPLEVADLIRSEGAAFLERNRQWIRWKHVKVLLAIARCRTAALGGHVDQCTRCGDRATISYNSCLMESGFCRRVRPGWTQVLAG
jgi:Transposase zinc-binding domain